MDRSLFGGLLILTPGRTADRYDLARQLRDLEELADPSEGTRLW
jgi:hypothetical protein